MWLGLPFRVLIDITNTAIYILVHCRWGHNSLFWECRTTILALMSNFLKGNANRCFRGTN